MKQKLLFLLTALMLLTTGNAWGDVIETVGLKNKTSGSGTHSNTPITLKRGETKIITFNNYGNTEYGQATDGWYNWRIQAKQGSTVQFEVRADAYDNKSKATTNYEAWNYQVSTVRGGGKGWLDWATFKTDMGEASCLATITYGTDGSLSLRATSECSAGRIYYHGHDVSGLNGSDVDIVFYVDHSYLEITDITSALGLVGAIDYTSGYATVWNDASKIWINPGEKAYYKIKNYNKGNGVAALYNNWCVWGATEDNDNQIIFCHNHSNTATHATYISKPDLTVEDLDGATVELIAELADAGNGTYTYTCTAITTKADGTLVSPNLVYRQTNLSSSKYKMYVSPDANWLAVLESAVKKDITSAGWATFYSSNNLDLEHATGLTDAYIVTGGENSVLKKTSVKGGTVPANTGLLLKGDAGTATIPVVASSSTNVDANKLVGVNAATEIAANAGYVLMGSPSLGFYQNSVVFTVGANTAYLPSNFDGSGARDFFRLEDDFTGINAIEAAEVKAEGLKDGKFLENGKIVLVKNGVKYGANGQKLN